MDARRGSTFRLVSAVVFLGAAVGIVVARLAWDSTEGCASTAVSVTGARLAADRVCTALVHTLAERAGAVTAVMTVVIVLTVVGLSRLSLPSASGPDL